MKHLIFTILIITLLACGGSSTSGKVGTATVDAEVGIPKFAAYKVGDIVQVKDYTIALNSFEVQGNLSVANFSIENKGTTDLAISSLLSFTAKDGEGGKAEQDYTCPSPLDGKVLPGDKLKGDICWVGNGIVKIYYEDNLFSSGAIVWEVE